MVSGGNRNLTPTKIGAVCDVGVYAAVEQDEQWWTVRCGKQNELLFGRNCEGAVQVENTTRNQRM